MIDINEIRPGAVTVLIGSNGSGKSRLLRQLCQRFIGRGEHVIAIAPSIYDRFKNIKSKRFCFYGARYGKKAAINVIRSALQAAEPENLQITKNLMQALRYTRFDPVIGLGLKYINLDNFSKVEERLSKIESDVLLSALMKWKARSDDSGLVRLSLDSFSFQELNTMNFAIFAQYDNLLYRSKVTSRIEYFLFRNGERIPLLEACSGELCFITTVAYIATQITRDSVIAIDEPETSLHPSWQKSYIQTLLDLFHRYAPRIIISTHSPIIISGAESRRNDFSNSNILVYELEAGGQARRFDHEKLSLEEMYDRLFGLITPKNHYLSQKSVEILNKLNARNMSLSEATRELEEMREKSYDESQQAVISKIVEIAREVDSKQG